MEAARALGQALHKHNFHMVYGAGTNGMMGEVAKTLVSLSGPQAVHGIIPKALLSHEARPQTDPVTGDSISTEVDPVTGLVIPVKESFGRTTIVQSMHERKFSMAKEVREGGPGSGFVAISGGYGTIEEIMEMTTWNQLGVHNSPPVLFNVEGYWNALLQWVRDACAAGFITESNVGILQSADSAEAVIETLKAYKPSEGRLALSWDSTWSKNSAKLFGDWVEKLGKRFKVAFRILGCLVNSSIDFVE